MASITIGASLPWHVSFGLTASLTLWLTSCSPAADAPGAQSPGADAGSTIIGCAGDSRAETYRPDMSEVGASKALTFILVGGSPAPPAIDDNIWTVKVLDSSGAPATNATFSSIKTWMPDHGHGSPETPMATPNADGTYTVQPLYLFMNGLWQITFTAQVGAVSDTATFSFCIGG